MHVLRFIRKVDSLCSAMDIIWKHVTLEYMTSRRRSWRKLDKFEIRLALFTLYIFVVHNIIQVIGILPFIVTATRALSIFTEWL